MWYITMKLIVTMYIVGSPREAVSRQLAEKKSRLDDQQRRPI